MNKVWVLCGSIVLVGSALPAAAASYTTVDLSTYANRSWANDWGVTSFPTGSQTLNGTPFVIPADTYTRYASVYGTVPGNASGTITITTDIAHATTAYSLINTIWGSRNPGLLSISFVGALGATQTFDLVGGSYVRDFNNYIYTNTINGTTTQNAVTVDGGNHRLDEQTYALDAAFLTQNIISVVLQDMGGDGYSRGALSGLTFAAATTGTVPEPASWALMLAGFGVVGGVLRRRAATVRVAA